MSPHEAHALVSRIRANIGQAVIGKDDVVDLLLTSLLAGGHALIEDVPGTGKTLLAKALARSIGCVFKRIQFTPDLLPSDVSGINFYHPQTGRFEFRPGPVFAGIVLADEINRATPRTQSSLLECMEERQVTIDGVTHALESPFIVVATQNPVDNQGTFPLPEAQMDRFLLRIRIGYPTAEQSVDILRRYRDASPLEALQAVASGGEVAEAQRTAAGLAADDELLLYMVRLAEASRRHPDVVLGISPRGIGALLRASQAYALVQGRDFVTPDDVKAVAVPVLAHRLMLAHTARVRDDRAEEIVRRLLAETPVPTEALPRV